MKLSKISSKGQITIPKSVRQILGVKAGDLVSFVVRKGPVSLRPVRSISEEADDSLSSTLSEWNSVQDDEVFRETPVKAESRLPIRVTSNGSIPISRAGLPAENPKLFPAGLINMGSPNRLDCSISIFRIF